MTAFELQVLLLLAIAFLVGLGTGLWIAGRRPARGLDRERMSRLASGTDGAGGAPQLPSWPRPVQPGASSGSGLSRVPAPSPFRPAEPEAPRPPKPLAPPPAASPEPAARSEPTPRSQPEEPDLFTRLGLTNGLVALAPRDPEPEPAPPPAPAPVRERGPDGHPGHRPPTLEAPEGEGADDLKLLRGIGPQNERRLNALGIFHFRQIAAWTPDEAAWVGSYLAFPGRIERENWIAQARALAAGEPPPEAPRRRR